MLDQYCVACHNQRVKTAEVAFDNADLTKVGDHAELWEKAIRKLKAGMMPPPGARRPEKATADAFASWLETSLDEHAAANPDPGRVAVHRLNRTEYAAAIEIQPFFQNGFVLAAHIPHSRTHYSVREPQS